ncbi:MAG: hypothetical protein J6K61_04660 [Clostridia bacterium]|nr:hypothetical protein [Clostridia bacterium]
MRSDTALQTEVGSGVDFFHNIGGDIMRCGDMGSFGAMFHIFLPFRKAAGGKGAQMEMRGRGKGIDTDTHGNGICRDGGQEKAEYLPRQDRAPCFPPQEGKGEKEKYEKDIEREMRG